MLPFLGTNVRLIETLSEISLQKIKSVWLSIDEMLLFSYAQSILVDVRQNVSCYTSNNRWIMKKGEKRRECVGDERHFCSAYNKMSLFITMWIICEKKLSISFSRKQQKVLEQ